MQFVGRFGLRFILPVVAVLAGALVTVVVSLDEMADAVNSIEQTTTARSVEAALKVTLRRIGDSQRDYAQWDDAVRNLYGTVDEGFVRENFIVSTADPVFFDTVILIDEDGNEIFGYRDGLALSLPALPSFGAEAIASLFDGLPRNGRDYEVRTGIVSTRNGLFAVAVGPVVPVSADFADRPTRARLLLVGRRLDDAAIARLGEDYQIANLHLVG
ncbi:MAG TPA: CHASE4 domain-containing protein, partial [Bauldia sp.]|nr:CHASE4 domain-containing protein [Bauldia sp.]